MKFYGFPLDHMDRGNIKSRFLEDSGRWSWYVTNNYRPLRHDKVEGSASRHSCGSVCSRSVGETVYARRLAQKQQVWGKQGHLRRRRQQVRVLCVLSRRGPPRLDRTTASAVSGERTEFARSHLLKQADYPGSTRRNSNCCVTNKVQRISYESSRIRYIQSLQWNLSFDLCARKRLESRTGFERKLCSDWTLLEWNCTNWFEIPQDCRSVSIDAASGTRR